MKHNETKKMNPTKPDTENRLIATRGEGRCGGEMCQGWKADFWSTFFMMLSIQN